MPETGDKSGGLIKLGEEYSEAFKGNNFINENEFLRHFEEAYEAEIRNNFQNDVNEELAHNVAKTIKTWLSEMNKSLDYIYNYDPTCDEEEVTKINNIDNRVCDPYLSIDDIDEDDIEEIINIASNKRIAKAQGKCAIRLRDGTEIIGRWQSGVRQGQGTTSSPGLERLGVSMLAGSYRDGALTGVGRAHMMDGSVREGWFCQGFAHGPWKGDIKGTGLVWIGSYKRGVASGLCWESILGGLWRVGWLDPDSGEFTGPGIASLYPDLRTAILGRYRRGQLVTGASARVTGVSWHEGILQPSFEKMSNDEFRQRVSTKTDIGVPPHLRDPYETQMVEVTQSSITGSGEGLQVRTDVEAGTIVAFYHGLRMSAKEENPFGGSTGYSIFLEWDRDKRDKADVLDLSPELQSTKNYTATLAHKVNHSFNPNCEWVHALHPCYGKVPAIKTCEDLRKGDELFIHYGFDMDEAPQWYKDFWMKQEL